MSIIYEVGSNSKCPTSKKRYKSKEGVKVICDSLGQSSIFLIKKRKKSIYSDVVPNRIVRDVSSLFIRVEVDEGSLPVILYFKLAQIIIIFSLFQ